MSRTIDERVVSMEFDNRKFETNVSTTLSTLDKLKQKLNFSDSVKGIKEITASSNKVDLSGISNAVESITYKFSAMGVFFDQTLRNMANSAYYTGKKIISALTIDPVKSGFSEYETQINAVQTILANTSHKGTTLEDVNRVLDELNTYADKTIYNFTQMTRNIGTFTAAGLGLEESASAIKGIANLAAVSGSTSQQASVAMYQLSQALANGRVNLQDWNSVVNAGMGGKVFQDALVRTAAAMKGVSEETFRAQNITGSFRESLSSRDGQGWLTTDVLSKTLQQFTGDLSDAELVAMGFTEQQIVNIQKMAVTANDAATKVKTLTQLWDTLKEAAQSGWTQSWEIIIGDFEEAKEVYTRISDAVGNMLNESADARNKVLSEGLSSGWKQFLNLESEVSNGNFVKAFFDQEGLKDSITEVAKAHNVAIDEMIEKEIEAGHTNNAFEKTLSKGWLTADILKESIAKLTEKTKNLSKEELENLGYTENQIKALDMLNTEIQNGTIDLNAYTEKFKILSGRQNVIEGFANIFKRLGELIKPIGEAFREVFDPITGDQIYDLTDKFKKFTDGLKVTKDVSDKIKATFKGLFSVVDMVKKVLSAAIKPIRELLKSEGVKSLATLLLDMAANIGNLLTSLNDNFDTSNLSQSLSKMSANISDFLKFATTGLGTLGDVFKKIGTIISTVTNTIWGALNSIFGWVSESITFKDFLDILLGVKIYQAADNISNAFNEVKDSIIGLFGSPGQGLSIVKEKVLDILDSLHEALKAFTVGVKAASILAIAVAMSVLTSALERLSKLSIENIAKGLITLSVMFLMMTKALGSIMSLITDFDKTKSFKELLKGKLFGKKSSLFTAASSLILIAYSLKVLGKALEQIGKIPLWEIAKGLVAIKLSLKMLVEALSEISDITSDNNIKNSASLVILAFACNILGKALAKFGEMNWIEIARGLVGMGGALTILVLTLGIFNKYNKTKVTSAGKEINKYASLINSGSLLILILGLGKLGDALSRIGKLSWEQISKGLYGIGAALAELGIVLGALNTINKKKQVDKSASLINSGSLLILILGLGKISDALSKISTLSWEQISKGLYGIGGVLTELGIVLGVLSHFTSSNTNKLSSVITSGSLLILILGLGKIGDSLSKISTLSWEQISKGLFGIGGALAELGIVLGVLSHFTSSNPLSTIVTTGSLVVLISGLEKITDALERMSAIDGDSLVRAVGQLGMVLFELATIVGILGGLGAGTSGLTTACGLIGAGSILLLVQGLGDIASALEILADIPADRLFDSVNALGLVLVELAGGGILNSLSIIGNYSISKVAPSIVTLAEAVKKLGELSYEQVSSGVNALKQVLNAIAEGGFANTLSGFGANAIAEMAGPLGNLADSVKKWNGIKVNYDIGQQLANLSTGLSGFIFTGSGAKAFATAAPAVGIMADSVSKWIGLEIPEGLSDEIKSLHSGIDSFMLSGTGANALSVAAPAVGAMAKSVMEWTKIKNFPTDIKQKLLDLSVGVSSFTWAFAGGWSIGEIVTPLKNLADSIKAWDGVILPEGLETNLTGLANGVKAFTWAFAGGWSIGEIITPLKNLAESVKAWNNVKFPEGLETNLTGLANGVKAFTFGFMGGISIGVILDPLKNLAESVKAWNDVKFPEGLETNLTGLANGVKAFDGTTISENIQTELTNMANGVKSFNDIGDLSVISANLGLLSDACIKLSALSLDNANVSLTNFISSINSIDSTIFGSVSLMLDNIAVAISSKIPVIMQAGYTLVTSFTVGIISQSGLVINVFSNIITQIVSAVSSKIKLFNILGRNLILNFTVGILSGTGTVYAVVRGMMETISSTISSYSFYDLGVSLVDGFAAGITAETFAAEAAARAMAQAAYNAAKEELDINSPSKVFRSLAYAVPEGFAAGIDKMGGLVKDSAVGMAQTAIESTKNAISKIGSVVSSDMDVQPTIRPVVDLNNFNTETMQLGANIDTSFTRPISSLSQMIASAQDDIYASNNEVIAAINDLRADINAIYSGDDQEIALYVDSKKLATSLAKPMNRQLNILSKKGAY